MLEEDLLLLIGEYLEGYFLNALFGEGFAGCVFEVVLYSQLRGLAHLEVQVACPGLYREPEEFIYLRLSPLRVLPSRLFDIHHK